MLYYRALLKKEEIVHLFGTIFNSELIHIFCDLVSVYRWCIWDYVKMSYNVHSEGIFHMQSSSYQR